MIFLEKCSLLVDRLGRTSECCIELEQKRGAGPLGTPLALRNCDHDNYCCGCDCYCAAGY